jgi:hypothetical protein
MLIHYFTRLKTSNEGETEMKTTEADTPRPSYWQLIFLQSKVNGARYSGEELPGRNWDWPKDTYLQRRLHQARFLQLPDTSKFN